MKETELVWESRWGYARQQLERVLVIDFLQNFVVEAEAVDAPEGVAVAVILEIFVARFERAEIPLVFVDLVDVFAHQDVILIFTEEIVRGVRLASQLSENSGD